MSARLRLVASLLIAMAVVIAVATVQLPARSQLWRAVNNAGHIPLFGILAVALLHVLRRPGSRCAARPLRCYAGAALLSVLTGAAVELQQYWGPRDADFADLVRDAAGTVAFLGLYATIDASLIRRFRAGPAPWRGIVRTLSVALLLAGLLPVLTWAYATAHRNANMPILCDFGSWWDRRFVTVQDSELDCASVGNGSTGNRPRRDLARLTFGSGPYPGMAVEEVYPDWRPYDSLIVVIEAPAETVPMITLRIDDRWHNGSFDDRYTRRFELHPGRNRLSIPLREIAGGPRHRPMDMSRISSVRLYADSAASGRWLFLGSPALR